MGPVVQQVQFEQAADGIHLNISKDGELTDSLENLLQHAHGIFFLILS